MYASNTATVLSYLGFTPLVDFNASSSLGVVSVEWMSASQQPTEQEIDTTAASQEFIDWQAENGGDQLKTLRKKAKDALSDSKSENALLRAVLLIIVDEFNNHSDKTNAILDAIDGASNLSGLKSSIGAINDLPQRTGAQLRTEVKTKLTNGDADS